MQVSRALPSPPTLPPPPPSSPPPLHLLLLNHHRSILQHHSLPRRRPPHSRPGVEPAQSTRRGALRHAEAVPHPAARLPQPRTGQRGRMGRRTLRGQPRFGCVALQPVPHHASLAVLRTRTPLTAGMEAKIWAAKGLHAARAMKCLWLCLGLGAVSAHYRIICVEGGTSVDSHTAVQTLDKKTKRKGKPRPPNGFLSPHILHHVPHTIAFTPPGGGRRLAARVSCPPRSRPAPAAAAPPWPPRPHRLRRLLRVGPLRLRVSRRPTVARGSTCACAARA